MSPPDARVERRGSRWFARWRSPDGEPRLRQFPDRQAAEEHLRGLERPNPPSAP